MEDKDPIVFLDLAAGPDGMGARGKRKSICNCNKSEAKHNHKDGWQASKRWIEIYRRKNIEYISG